MEMLTMTKTKAEMNIYQNERYPVALSLTDSDIIVTLNDGTKITNPLDWFPWLRDASPEQKQGFRLYHSAIFWESLEDGLDIEGMLRGIKPRYPQKAAPNA
jgi:hypothetical protein